MTTTHNGWTNRETWLAVLRQDAMDAYLGRIGDPLVKAGTEAPRKAVSDKAIDAVAELIGAAALLVSGAEVPGSPFGAYDCEGEWCVHDDVALLRSALARVGGES